MSSTQFEIATKDGDVVLNVYPKRPPKVFTVTNDMFTYRFGGRPYKGVVYFELVRVGDSPFAIQYTGHNILPADANAAPVTDKAINYLVNVVRTAILKMLNQHPLFDQYSLQGLYLSQREELVLRLDEAKKALEKFDQENAEWLTTSSL